MSEEMNLYKRCKNIFKFHGVDMGGGESAPEVENAIETHGLGWTDTEEVEGFDIQWDGDTEDREYFTSADVTYVKVADAIFNDISELYGAKIVCASEEVILDDNNCLYDEGYYMLNYFGIYLPIDDEDISAGLYFLKGRNYYTSSLTKEATTEEVVHQIDQKYIPGGGGGDSQTVVKITLTENPEGESSGSPYIIESDLTASEIGEAFESSNVVAWVYCKNYSTDGWTKMYQLNCMACLNAGEDATIVFSEPFNMGGGTSILTLSFIDEEWNYSVTPIPQPETNE